MVTLVLLPGMDGTGELFAPFVAALGPDQAVTVVRYPAEPALGYAELESFARAALPADRPFVLVGESFSGPIAIRIAADPPPNLVGVVLSTTFARAPLPGPSVLALLAPLMRLAPVRAAPGRCRPVPC